MLLHLFDRFYVVTRFVLPRIEDLKFMTIWFDSSCKYLGTGKRKTDYPSNHIPNLTVYCKTIVPYVDLYKKQVAHYNKTAYKIMKDEIDLILPTFLEGKRSKKGIITSLITDFMGFAYEGISSLLLHERHKVFHKAVNTMNTNMILEKK